MGRSGVEQYIAKRLAARRTGFQFLQSVHAYLTWRIESVRVRGLSWRNQPAELANYSRAIFYVNQALAQDVSGEIDNGVARLKQSDSGPAIQPTDTKSNRVPLRDGSDNRRAKKLSLVSAHGGRHVGQSALVDGSEPPAILEVPPPLNPHHGEQMKQLLLSLIEQSRDGGITYREFIQQAKVQYVIRVLQANRFNQSAAARELGMHRNTMARTIDELGIDLQALITEQTMGSKKAVQRIAAQTVPAAMVQAG